MNVHYSPSATHILRIGQAVQLELLIGEGRPERIGFVARFHGSEVDRGEMGWRDVAGLLSFASAVSRYAVPPTQPGGAP